MLSEMPTMHAFKKIIVWGCDLIRTLKVALKAEVRLMNTLNIIRQLTQNPITVENSSA
jgi:hypothetical protein